MIGFSVGWLRRSLEAFKKVLRGGSWNNPAENLRAAERNRNPAGNRNDDIGFRLAAAPANTPTTPLKTNDRHRQSGPRAGVAPGFDRAPKPLSPPVLVGFSRASGRAVCSPEPPG